MPSLPSLWRSRLARRALRAGPARARNLCERRPERGPDYDKAPPVRQPAGGAMPSARSCPPSLTWRASANTLRPLPAEQPGSFLGQGEHLMRSIMGGVVAAALLVGVSTQALAADLTIWW